MAELDGAVVVDDGAEVVGRAVAVAVDEAADVDGRRRVDGDAGLELGGVVAEHLEALEVDDEHGRRRREAQLLHLSLIHI